MLRKDPGVHHDDSPLAKKTCNQVADARVVGRSPHPNTASGLRGVSDAFLDEETLGTQGQRSRVG